MKRVSVVDECDTRTEEELAVSKKTGRKSTAAHQRGYIEKFLRVSEFLKYIVEFSKSILKIKYETDEEKEKDIASQKLFDLLTEFILGT